MTKNELIQVFRKAGVNSKDLEENFNKFLNDQSDIRIKDLNMDSLIVMEVCIALEEIHGLSLTVHEFKKLNHVSEILDLVK